MTTPPPPPTPRHCWACLISMCLNYSRLVLANLTLYFTTTVLSFRALFAFSPHNLHINFKHSQWPRYEIEVSASITNIYHLHHLHQTHLSTPKCTALCGNQMFASNRIIYLPSQQDQHPGAGYNGTVSHHHRWL